MHWRRLSAHSPAPSATSTVSVREKPYKPRRCEGCRSSEQPGVDGPPGPRARGSATALPDAETRPVSPLGGPVAGLPA